MNLDIVIRRKSYIGTLPQKGSPFSLDQAGLNKMKPQQTFYCGMAFRCNVLELEGGFRCMKDGVICTGHGIGVKPIPATGLSRAQTLSGPFPFGDDQASIHPTRTPSRVIAW